MVSLFFAKSMAIIYHVTTQPEWLIAQQQGFYTAPSLEAEGFIHCSKAEQVEGVLHRYFKGKNNLIRLVIDTDKVAAPFQYEVAPSVNQEFPHIYGPINLDAVIAIEKI